MPQWKGDYAKCADISTLEPGDQIAIWDYGKYFRYQHHGLIWKAGTTIHDIQVCHIWSPFEDRVQSQADSHFRISTLEQFLYKRPLSALRLVEYSTSKSRRVLSDLGEVHSYPSDCPEIVLARSKFLLGLGKGEFDIFTQNCEHTAHWCKTGIQYCSQDMTMAAGSIPFKKEMSVTQQKSLHVQIKAIQDSIELEMNRLVGMSGQLVYVRQKGPQKDRYLKVDDKNSQVKLVQGSDPKQVATPFRLHCTLERYDRVHISLEVESDPKFLCSHKSWNADRDIKMKKTDNKRATAYTWEYRSTGHLVSERQHRRYCAVKKNGILEESSLRGKATKFVFVKADDESLAPVPFLPDISTPVTNFPAFAASHTPGASSHPPNAPMPQIQEEDDKKDSVGVEEPIESSS